MSLHDFRTLTGVAVTLIAIVYWVICLNRKPVDVSGGLWSAAFIGLGLLAILTN